jgi:galactokinase
MTVDVTHRLSLPPGLRVATSAYATVFGRPPATVWQVPGTVTLLADGPLRLTVATPWGTIAAAGPRDDDIIDLVRVEHPGARQRLTASEAASGAGPDWAGTGLTAARGGATLLVKAELPEGSGVGAQAATQAAIGLCLGEGRPGEDLAGPSTVPGSTVPGSTVSGSAVLGDTAAGCQRLPFDLATAGLRLVIIDTRIRSKPPPAPAESSPVAVAASILREGDITAIGPLLTAAHKAMACDDVQQAAVSAALRAGALGARAIADGPGRPACALVPVDLLADVRVGVGARFARERLRPPRFLTFTAMDGPRWLGHACQA